MCNDCGGIRVYLNISYTLKMGKNHKNYVFFDHGRGEDYLNYSNLIFRRDRTITHKLLSELLLGTVVPGATETLK